MNLSAISIGAWVGWATVVAVAGAGMSPIIHRLVVGRRFAPDSRIGKLHVALGASASAIATAHTIFVLPRVGAPSAMGAEDMGLVLAVATFFVLVAHVGIGLRLRRPKLRDRPKFRRIHAITATLIVIGIAFHIALFESSK